MQNSSFNNFLCDGKNGFSELTHGSLFSGIGGFDLAAEWIGWNNAFHCEFEDYKRIKLEENFPK